MHPLKTKSADDVIPKFRIILSDAKTLLPNSPTDVHPNYIASDEEEAFKEITYQQFKIQRIIAQGKYGAAPVESFIREFKSN